LRALRNRDIHVEEEGQNSRYHQAGSVYLCFIPVSYILASVDGGVMESKPEQD
jgi:hypothetical protein